MGRSCRYPYPPNRQADATRQSNMEMARTTRTMRSTRSCIEQHPSLYQSGGTLPCFLIAGKGAMRDGVGRQVRGTEELCLFLYFPCRSELPPNRCDSPCNPLQGGIPVSSHRQHFPMRSRTPGPGACIHIRCGAARQWGHRTSVGVHNVYVIVPAPVGAEDNTLSAIHPGRIPVTS